MKKYILEPKEPMTVLSALRNRGVYISADCAGRGTCGKCKVIVDGEETLACKTVIEKKTEVEFFDKSLLGSIYVENIDEGLDGYLANDKKDERSFFMCADIGTTTVAAVLIDSLGKVLASAGCANSQKSLGADVVSRIEAAEAGKLSELKSLVRGDIAYLRSELCRKLSLDENLVEKVYISANTVMEHIFAGYSMEGFAKAPYRAVTLDTIRDGEFELLACLFPFVGADILSGIAVCGLDRSDKLSALIDLGTNGEMAIGNRDKILTASTAAGPVFEGGAISCGMMAAAGAISDAEISGMRAFVKTIGEQPAAGICGSGLVSAVHGLRKNGIIDKNGIFIEEFIEDGFPLTSDIYITKEDNRNFLMAKSAIAAGFKTLCREMNIEPSDIENLYIAGGFGKHLNIEKAAGIGLIPDELKDRCVLAGNTSLKGAIMRGLGNLDDGRISDIKGLCGEIVLADSLYFRDEYIKNMVL